jgi:hypothetical protein
MSQAIIRVFYDLRDGTRDECPRLSTGDVKLPPDSSLSDLRMAVHALHPIDMRDLHCGIGNLQVYPGNSTSVELTNPDKALISWEVKSILDLPPPPTGDPNHRRWAVVVIRPGRRPTPPMAPGEEKQPTLHYTSTQTHTYTQAVSSPFTTLCVVCNVTLCVCGV